MEKNIKNYTEFVNEAYVSKEKMKQVQQDIKKEFPEFKFSIRKENYSTVNVSIMSGPISLTDKENGYETINPYWYKYHYKDNPVLLEFFTKLFDIINVGNFDKSDPMSDYFHVGFYVDLTIGQWDKPYVIIDKSTKVSVKDIKPKFKRFDIDDIEEKPKNLRYFESKRLKFRQST